MEEILLAGHPGIKNRLEHEVAQLFGQIVPVAAVDGVEHLVGLFEGVGLDAVEGLLAVPRTAAGGAQAGHDIDQFLKFFAGVGIGFHVGRAVFSM